MAQRPIIGQPAPRFALDVHGIDRRWSLADEIEHGRPIVLIFHRHLN